MPKLNRNYVSFLEYYFGNSEIVNSKWDDESSTKERLDLGLSLRWSSTETRWWHQLIGALQPVADIWKDLIDTFKPYKYMAFANRSKEGSASPIDRDYQFGRGIMQPFLGIGNILEGALSIIGAPLLFAGKLLLTMGSTMWNPKNFTKNCQSIAKNFLLTGSWILEGVLRIVRGSIQVLFTVAIIKPLIRAVISSYDPKIEQNNGIQYRVKIAKQLSEANPANKAIKIEQKNKALFDTCHDIHRKFKKCQKRGQATAIEQATEALRYQNILVNRTNKDTLQSAASSYLSLFAKEPSQSTAIQPGINKRPCLNASP